MPLLPLTSKDTAMDVFMAGDLNSISQFIAPEYLKEEILELVSESMEESSSFLMEVLGEAEQPSQVEEITHRIPLEFEMPLSPRYPAVCESLIAVERPKRELEDIFEKPKHELDVSSSTANLFEAFGLSEHDQVYNPTREEQLTLFDTALRITEPPVKAITLQQGLRKLPVSMSSLRRPKNDTGVMYVAEIIPAKHLDIHVRWTPFINSAHRYSIEEYLEGGDLVNDFVDIEDESELEQFEGLIDQELLQEPTTPLYRQSSPGSWADTSFKAVEVKLTPDGAAIPLNQGSGKRLTLMDYETPRPSYDHKFRDHDRLQGVMKQDAKVLNLLEDETVSHSLHPDSVYVSENEQQCHKLSSSCGIKFQMLQGSDLPNLSTNISWAMSDSAPDQSKLDLLPRDHSNARSTEEVAELSDDSLTRLLRRRKRARQSEASPEVEVEVEVEEQGGHCRGNIDDYIRLNNNQSPPKIKTQKAVKRPKKQPLPIQRPESTQARQEIVPTLDKSDEAGRIWMISSTLLQQSTLIRQLRERNPGVTFIERDLDSMKEADLILSSTSGIALLHIEHLLRSDTHREGGEVLMPAQLRMLNLSSRYSSLCLVILFNGSLTFDQRKALVEFQGWLSSKLTVTVILSGSHSEQLSYLDYFATKYAPNLVTCGTATGEEDVENPHEAFLRACPLLNAMSAYLILQHCSLLDFLAFNINERRELLSSIGVVLDSQALGIHAYFCASWHETEKLNLQA